MSRELAASFLIASGGSENNETRFRERLGKISVSVFAADMIIITIHWPLELRQGRSWSRPDRFLTINHEFLPKGNPNRVYLTTMCLVSNIADTPLSPPLQLTPRSIHYQPPRSRQHNPSCQEW